MRKEDLFIYGYDCEVVWERVERGDVLPEAVGPLTTIILFILPPCLLCNSAEISLYLLA